MKTNMRTNRKLEMKHIQNALKSERKAQLILDAIERMLTRDRVPHSPDMIYDITEAEMYPLVSNPAYKDASPDFLANKILHEYFHGMYVINRFWYDTDGIEDYLEFLIDYSDIEYTADQLRIMNLIHDDHDMMVKYAPSLVDMYGFNIHYAFAMMY